MALVGVLELAPEAESPAGRLLAHPAYYADKRDGRIDSAGEGNPNRLADGDERVAFQTNATPAQVLDGADKLSRGAPPLRGRNGPQHRMTVTDSQTGKGTSVALYHGTAGRGDRLRRLPARDRRTRAS